MLEQTISTLDTDHTNKMSIHRECLVGRQHWGMNIIPSRSAIVIASFMLAATTTLAMAQSGGGASGEGAIGGGSGAPGGGTGIPGDHNFGLAISSPMMSAINELGAEQIRTMRQYGHITMTPRMRHAINVIAAERRRMRRHRQH